MPSIQLKVSVALCVDALCNCDSCWNRWQEAVKEPARDQQYHHLALAVPQFSDG